MTGRCTKPLLISMPPQEVRRGSSRLLPGASHRWREAERSGGSLAASGDLAAAGGRDLVVELGGPHLGAVEVPGHDHLRAGGEVRVGPEPLVERDAALLVEG